VDGTATVRRVDKTAGQWVVWFDLDQPEATSRYLIPKGSIAIDGVSLTLAEVRSSAFSVALIPTTLERTTLPELQTGYKVNIETDLLARIVVRQMEAAPQAAAELSFQSLRRAGFE
jgi:riboflavin synthase alpha subunit